MSDLRPTGAARLERALRAPGPSGRLALIPYLTAGFPEPAAFGRLVTRIAAVGDAVEIGVPFSDPIADGVTIQRASRTALQQGMTLHRVLAGLEGRPAGTHAPMVLMSYLNPLLSYGFEALARDAAAARVDGIVVPDLPLEECEPLRSLLDTAGIALVQIVSPATPRERLLRIVEASRGFVYAVTVTGITGGRVELPDGLPRYLDGIRSLSTLPVVAGFGIRRPAQARALRGHADGVIVGSAVVELLEQGRDPLPLLRSIRAGGMAAGPSP